MQQNCYFPWLTRRQSNVLFGGKEKANNIYILGKFFLRKYGMPITQDMDLWTYFMFPTLYEYVTTYGYIAILKVICVLFIFNAI